MLSLLAALPALIPVAAAYSNYNLGNLPHTSEAGQTGYNDCGTTDSQSSMCQTAHINSVTDFCLWAPPTPGGTIGDTEQIEITYCTATGHGARVMPQGTIKSAHYLTTPHYTQVTGTGDFTKINIQAGDEGGELDPHGADGLGNPHGALVFNNGVQIHEWTSFISDSEFCFRVCHDADDAWLWCQHIYDIQGKSSIVLLTSCAWNEPGDYGAGFDSCDGDSTEYPPGIYMVNGQLSTYQQSQGAAPTPHAAGKSSNCQAVATVGGAAVAAAPVTSTSAPAASSSATPASSSASSLASSASSLVSSASSDSASSSSSWTTSVVSSSSSVVSSSASSSSLSSSSSASSSAPVSTLTVTSSTPSASSAASGTATAAGLAASGTSGASRVVLGAGASLFAVAGAMALFA